MAAAFVRRAFKGDDDAEDSPPQLPTAPKQSQIQARAIDSSGDESTTDSPPAAAIRHQSAVAAYGRFHHLISQRQDDSGDLRPTTPPTGPSPRNRQADRPAAALQPTQSDTLHGPSTGGIKEGHNGLRGTGAPIPRRHSVAGLRVGTGPPPSSTKAAAARALHSSLSSSDDDAGHGAIPDAAPAAMQEVSMRSLGHPAVASLRSTRSLSKSTPSGSLTGEAAGPSASPSRRSSIAGRASISDGGVISGSFASAAAAELAGLKAQAGGYTSQQHRASRTSRLRRVSSNASLSSKASQPESLASSRLTAGSSKVSQTVQRTIARQRLVESSSGEDEGSVRQGSCETGQEAAVGVVPNSNRESLAAAVIAAAQATAAAAAAARRHPSAPAAARHRQEAAAAGGGHDEAAFSFRASSGSSLGSDSLTPLMREATAAATAEVAAAAAASLRPLPITAISPARLSPHTRPVDVLDPPVFDEVPQGGVDDVANYETAFVNVGSAAAAAHAAAAAAQAAKAAAMAELQNSQRIATWLEQQPRPPSLSSAGCVDDLASEQATVVVGTEVEVDVTSGAAAYGANYRINLAAHAGSALGSGGMELSGLCRHAALDSNRLRAESLTISSTDDDSDSNGGAAAAATEDCEQAHVDWQRAVDSNHMPSGGEQASAITSTAESTDASTAPTFAPVVRRLDFPGSISAGAGLSDTDKEHMSRHFFAPLERPQARSPAAAPRPAPVAAGMDSVAGAGRRVSVKPASRGAASGQHAAPGALPSRSSPAGTSARMTPSKLRAMLSILARPAHAPPASGSPSRGPSLQPSQDAESVQSMSYSEMLQMLQELSPVDGISLPQPVAGASTDVASGVSKARAGRTRAGRSSGSAARHSVASEPSVGAPATSAPLRGRQQKSAEVGASGHPSHGGMTAAAATGSVLSHEDNMAAPLSQDLTNTGVTLSSHWGGGEQQQRDFADLVRLWTMLTGRRLAFEAMDNHSDAPVPTEHGASASGSPQSTTSTAQQSHATARSGGTGSDVPSSAAIWAASAAAMATSAVLAAAAGGSQQLQTAYQYQQQHPFQPGSLGATAAAHNMQSPLPYGTSTAMSSRSNPVVGPNITSSSQPGGQPNYASFASLPQELQHLARLVSAPDHTGAGGLRLQSGPGSSALPHGDLAHLSSLLVAAGISGEQQLQVSAAEQVGLVQLLRILSATGLTGAPSSATSIAQQADTVQHVGQPTEAANSAAATSIGIPAASTATTATSTAAAAPEPLEAAPQQPMDVVAAMLPDGATSSAGTAARSGNVGTVAAGPLSTHSSADTVDTGLALSRVYTALRNMRLRDEGGQTDPPGTRTSNTQTSPDLRASHMRDEEGQTDTPVSSSSGSQTENLRAGVASGVVQIDVDDLRAFATRSKAGQTDLPSCESISVQTQLAELVPTSEGSVQTDISHLRGGPCRGVQTDVAEVAPAGSQTEASWLSQALPSAATQTLDDDANLTAVFSAEVQEELARAALAAGQLSPRLSAEAQAEVLRLARVLAAAGQQAEAEQPTLSAETQAQLVRTLRTVANPVPSLEWGSVLTSVDSGHTHLSSELREGPATSDCEVQTDLTAVDFTAPNPQPDLEASSNASADSSITAAPAIPTASHLAAEPSVRMPSPPTSTQIGTAFALRNLPIASDGGIMDAPHQEAVVAGRVGSSGGMLAYLEAADPTTATALMELMQALQVMTMHKRRRRWISDGSSRASGECYHDAETPSSPPSIRRSSGAVTTLWGSFVTSIGPSVSQAGQASLAGAEAAAEAAAAEEAMAAAGAVDSATPPAVKAATVGGEGVALQADAAGCQRHSFTAGLPPRPAPPPTTAAVDSTARHLQRALRAVSNGGGHRRATGGGPMSRGTNAVTSPASAEAHIALALELLSRAAAPAAGSTSDEEAELRAQEELVAAMLALLVAPAAPSAANITGAADAAGASVVLPEGLLPASAEPSLSVAGLEALASIGQSGESLAVPQEEGYCEVDAPVASVSASDSEPDIPTAEASPLVRAEVPRSETPSPSAMLRAEIQVALQQAERASASVTSLHTGYLPATPRAAEVLDGLPFEQAVGYILDGLRNFEGPAKLARNLHLARDGSRSTSTGGASWEGLPALETQGSRLQATGIFGSGTMLAAVVEGPGKEVDDGKPQPLSGLQNEVECALPAVLPGRQDSSSASPSSKQLLMGHVEAAVEVAASASNGLVTEVPVAHASPSAVRLLEQLSDLGIISLGPADSPDAAGALRSAPVTTAGSAPAALQLFSSPTPAVVSPQTFGGAMDLPADSALGPDAHQRHSVPYLPCGGLDDQLRPVHSVLVLASTGGQEAGQSPAAAAVDTEDESKHGSPLLPVSTAGAFAPWLPTFAMPSAPAVNVTPQQPTRTAASVGGVESFAASPLHTMQAFAESPNLPEVSGEEQRQQQTALAEDACLTAEDERVAHDASPGQGSPQEPQMVQPYELLVGAAAVPDVLAVPRSAPTTMGGEQLPVSRPLQTAGGFGAQAPSHADPQVPTVTARERFRMPGPYRSSPLKPASPMRVLMHNVSVPVGFAASAALPLAATSSAAAQTSAWSDAADGYSDDSFPAVRLARDAMAGCYAKPAAMEAPAVEATAAGGVRRALFPNSSGAGEQQRVDEGVATAPVTDASTAAASPSNLLLTQAAQLLLQAMQRSAEDHPEQQSAFAVLAPVLAGLAATGPEGQSASAASDRALPHQSSAQAEPTAQEPDMAAAVPLAEQQQETALQQLLLESEELPPMDSSSFAFLMGEPGEAQAQTPSAAATPSAVPHSPALATAADLEAFKGDIMSSVRTALMEIVDLIGHSVVQRAAATAGTPANAISGVGGNKGGHAYQPELESARNEAHEYGEAGIEEEDSHATTVGGVSVTVEPSASSYALGADQQEIRITRSELEAFMFGKALLNSSTTSDLLGVRLRDLYARQLSQDAGDEELAGGYEASSVRSQDDGAPDDDASSAADSRIGVNDPQRHSSDCFQSPLPHASRGSDRSGNGLDSSPLRGSEPGPSGFGVPRHSPLRQPLGDGVDFKSLFRRSMEHLRDHLQQHDGAASIAQRASAPSPVRAPSPTIAMASASAGPSPSAATIRKPPMPPKRPPIPQQFMSEAVSGAGLAAAAEGTSAALDKADSGAFETTFAPSMPPSLAQQLAAAAARAVAESQADLEAAARAADDVELDMPHLAARAEPTTGVAWCPDPAFPAPQSMAHTHLASSLPAESSAPVEVAISAAEAFGDFLAALAEPVVQVAGLFMPPDPRVGGRGFPQRTVVIEELREEDGRRGAEGAAAREHFRAERPSNVPGYAAGGAGWLEDEDAYVDSPRARSETSSPRLRLRHPVLADPRLQLSRSTSDAVHLHAAPAASSLDVLVSSRQQQQNQASTQQSVATPPLQQSSSTSVHLQSPHSSLPSRLKHVSVPGGRLVTESPAEEDRPLSSFASPSSVSEAGAPVASSSRRHTLSPGPLSRMAPTRSGSVGATGSAPGAPAAVPASASAASPVSRLEELEVFLQAFKLRIGADEEAVPLRALQLAATAAATGVTPSIAEVDVFDGVSSSEGSNDGQELGRMLAALAAFGEEEQGVATGYNLHTIRASAASAMAAAAAVEQVFSPRLADMLGANDVIPEEHELSILPSSAGVSAIAVTDPQPGDEAGGAGSVEDGGAGGSVAGLSNSASSVSNPLLREHLEHFQALLEKANDLVDRLMVADEEVTSEAATDGTGTNATPRQRATPASASASAIRRQLHNRLTAAAAASLVVTPSSTPRRRSVQVGAVSPVLSVAGAPSTPLPSLDPELAALFPATAARLSRPHALLEQSQDAALTLVSSAVTAVPQLAVGANRARSLSTTPSSRSPTGSIISVTTVATSATITAAAPVAAAAQNPTATPLALVAALLAEAHSRMEFRSLDEQRGADKILSAVLDEHFAHVLGTPRGFLTPAREPQWLNAAAAAAPAATTAAAGDAPAAATTSQAHRLLQRAPEPQPFVGPANLSEAFNQAAVAGGAAAAAVPSPAPRHKVVDLMDEPAVLQSPDPQPATRPQPPLPLLPPRATQQQQVAAEAQTASTAVLEVAEAAAASSPQPHEHQAASGTHEQPRSDADDLFGQLMQERSDILISALEQVHRVAPSSQASAEPPTAVCSQSSLPSSPVTRGHSSVPDAVASAFASGTHAPTGLPEPFMQATSQLEDQLRHLADSSGASSASGEAPAPAVAAAAPSSLSRELPAVLDALPVPATSVGPHAPLPQPLMPYQEADSESVRTSYATSLAGSIRQHGVVQPDLESPLWSRVPSAPGGSGAPSDMLSRGTAPLYVVSAGGASTLTSSLGGDSAMSAPAGPPRTGALDLAMLIAEEDSSVSAGADSNKSPVRLPPVPRDSASRGVGMVDGKASSNAAGTGRVGGGGRSDYASPASASQTPVSPAQRVLHESTSESETFLSYTTGDAVYEHRNSELVTVAMAVNGPAVHREAPIGTLRYNPVYDPSSSLAESAQAAFGAFAQRSSSGGSGSTQSAGMTTLHHETAYTPLALAAADSVGPLGELVSVELHSRLLSAGGTTTAVLVPNPAFDLMDDSFDDTPLSASEASVIAATAVALEGGFADSVDVSCMHPVLRLDFAGAATAGVDTHGSIEADTPTPASAAVPVLPLSPVDIAASPPSRLAGATQEVTPRGAVDSTVASGNQLASPVNPASFGGSADDLLSLLGPELTDSQLSLLAAAPELPYSRPQSRSHSLRLSGSSQQLQQQLLHGYHFLGPFARHREFSGGGAIVVAEGSEARVSREDSTAGSFDFEEISREAAAVVDNLATPHDAAVSAGGLSEGFRAQFRPLMAVDEEVDEPAVRESVAAAEAAEQQAMPASSPVKPAKAGLVAAAVRRIESGLTPTGAEAAAAAGNDKATPAGFKSPKPAGKPAGRSSPGIPPRPAFSPGASRPGSVASSSSVLGGRSRRNSRSGSGASLADEQLKGTDAAGFTAAAAVGPAPVVAAEAATGVSLSGSEAPFAPASSRSLGASTSGGSVGDVLALERTLVTREWLPMSGEDSMPDPTAAEQMYGSFLPLSYGSIGVRLHGSGAVLLAADTAPAGMLVEPQGWEQRPRSAGAGGRPSSTPGDAAAGRSVTPGPRPRVQGGSSTSEAAKGGAVGRQRSPAGANMIGAGTAARSKSSSADGSGLFQ